ncbi:hypothetical protein TNIN_458831 [Trichonephila inaurata madagascariensis]|uniref:Uncharacterized protein n=1 Tax=Trichonephila inaurata madagascariensis TaxID=2747483 RepID=A0A8X6XKQ3_9ARAC|nr:hypothetical protein TNIN_458831 [Trichonephila inaurata madagascariensis]
MKLGTFDGNPNARRERSRMGKLGFRKKGVKRGYPFYPTRNMVETKPHNRVLEIFKIYRNNKPSIKNAYPGQKMEAAPQFDSKLNPKTHKNSPTPNLTVQKKTMGSHPRGE